MKLDDAQVSRVREWIDQGLKVSEIQTRLAEELGVRITYMEARFLLDDLKLRPKDTHPTAVPTPVLGGPAASAAGPAGPGVGLATGSAAAARPGTAGPGLAGTGPLKTVPLGEAEVPGGGVRVTVDEITRPGLVVSGKVTFSDGQVAEWGIDQMGRPMLMPKTQGYRPSQGDVIDFQEQLGQVLGRMGY